MSYVTLNEACDFIGRFSAQNLAAWEALDKGSQTSHLLSASLWLNFSFDWVGDLVDCEPGMEEVSGYPHTLPHCLGAIEMRETLKSQWPRKSRCHCELRNCESGCLIPEGEVPLEVKVAQSVAAATGVGVSLFTAPVAVGDQGALVRRRVKAGSVEVDQQWAEPERGSQGQLIIQQVDALVQGLGTRRGTKVGRLVDWF